MTTATATRGRFAWHELLTTDPVAAQAFYKRVVGWDAQRWEGGNHDYTMWMAGHAPVGGVMTLPAEAVAMGAPPHWLTYMEVADIDATIAQATRLGGRVVVPAQTVAEVGRFAVLSDPQGAIFGIIANETPLPPETDPKALEFSWHELVTTDYKAADRFYTELFGWESKSDFDMGDMGTYHMFGRDRFTYGGMFTKPADMSMPPHWMPYALVDSADAAAERATKAGGTVINGPMEVPGGDRIAAIVDPQGVAFSVHSKKA